MRIALQLAVVLLASGPALAGEAAPPWSPFYGRLAVTDSLAAACAGIVNTFECARAIERVQLGQAHAPATRHGETLTIAAGGRKLVRLRDRDTDTAEVEAYRYMEYVPQLKQHLVLVQHYESVSYLLIDASTGTRTHIVGVPLLSPHARRFVCVQNDMFDHAIEVWRLTPQGLRRESVRGPEAWLPIEASWLEEHVLQIRQEEGEDPALRPRILHMRNGEWVVED